MYKVPTNYNSFGMDAYPGSTRWRDIVRGPSSAQVRAHVAKLASFLDHVRSNGSLWKGL
jgi:hypothetical protein